MNPGRLFSFLSFFAVAVCVALPSTGCARSGGFADDVARTGPRPVHPEGPREPNPQVPQVPHGAPANPQEGAQRIRNDIVRRTSSDSSVDWKDRVCRAHDALDRYLDAAHAQRVQDVVFRAQQQGIVITQQEAEEAVGYVEGKETEWGNALRKGAFGLYCATG